MAHFARIEGGIVQQVIVVENSELLDADGNESEKVGQAFIASIGLEGEWVQTSYNAAKTGFRGRYAGIGNVYDADADRFIDPAELLELVDVAEQLPAVK